MSKTIIIPMPQVQVRKKHRIAIPPRIAENATIRALLYIVVDDLSKEGERNPDNVRIHYKGGAYPESGKIPGTAQRSNQVVQQMI